MIKDFELLPGEQQFGEACELQFTIKQVLLDSFLEKMTVLQSSGTALTLDMEKK